MGDAQSIRDIRISAVAQEITVAAEQAFERKILSGTIFSIFSRLEEFVKKIRLKGREPNFTPPNPVEETGQISDHSILFGGDFPTYNKLTAIYTNEALRRSHGNKSEAARLAGLARTTFINYWEDSNRFEADKKRS